ncbi:hypothetical protein ACWCYY_38570 [Kitasatospora sp. NPDC001664]|uniref:hypothetical protein n=1 Tax=Kitasatospora sp. NPDC051853 TaxID=3364058 RepID=UPI0037AEA266
MHLTFDPAEADGLREAARDAALEDPRLAYVLLDLAEHGVDLNRCRTWDEIRAERGLPDDQEQQVA